MNKKISFEEVGGTVTTFYVQAGVKVGQVVGLAEGEMVGPCGAGQRLCGVALSVATDGVAAVQISGFVTVPVSGSGVVPGWVNLTADGNGGVKKTGSGEAGAEYLVVSTDEAAKTAVIWL